jgi:hypothetical protein
MIRQAVGQLLESIRRRVRRQRPRDETERQRPHRGAAKRTDSNMPSVMNAGDGGDLRSLRKRSYRLELPVYKLSQEQMFDQSETLVSTMALLAIHEQITGLRPWNLLRENGDVSKTAVSVIIDIFKYVAIIHGATELLFWTDSRVVQTSNSVHLFARDGIVTIRRGIPVREWLHGKRQSHSQEGRFFVYNFNLSGRSRVGGMAVAFSAPSADARLSLTLISQSLSQLVAQARYLHISANADKLTEYFSRYFERKRRPGTIFANAVEKILSYLSGDATSYVTLSGSKGVIEYRAWAPNHNNLLDNHPWHDLPAELILRIRSRQPFYFDSRHLAVILSGDSRPRKILILPLTLDRDIIGFFACEFFGRRPQIDLELLPKIHKSVVPLSAHARWLYQRRADSLIVDPIYRGRDTDIVEGRCCVLMPFAEDWSDRVLNRALRPTIMAAGFQLLRADDLYGHDVMEDVWSMILTSEVVIADISNRNANVFYELGIAHTVGKQVILLTQSVQDIPFDLNRYRQIVYQDNVEGFETLEGSLSRYLGEVIASRAS